MMSGKAEVRSVGIPWRKKCLGEAGIRLPKAGVI